MGPFDAIDERVADDGLEEALNADIGDSVDAPASEPGTVGGEGTDPPAESKAPVVSPR